MHLYAKFDKNILCGSRVMSINSLTEDGRTHIVIIVQTQGSCNFISAHYLRNIFFYILMELDQNLHNVLI